MEAKISLDSVYAPSEEVVSRRIEGEVIIVPLTSGIGDIEDELFTLNETGQAIWRSLDGKRSLKDIVTALRSEYEAPEGEIEKDVVGLLEELLKRRIVIAV